ncbi:hypothetical protein ABZ478_22970 [Streptomyces sp. NPDC005706]|uniref:hypothetical protein n=1 Tax=Streptomyces sp. NPDC005706 TaxID=3157169 RepID=UPI0034002230
MKSRISGVQMTEPFATTTAAVAPVILIAAALEVTAYQRAIQGWVTHLVQELEPELLPLLDLSVDDRRATIRRVVEAHAVGIGLGMMKVAVRWAAGFLWAAIMVAQAAVTIICLAWLGEPKRSAHPGIASACLLVVGAGAVAVASFPMYRLMNAPWMPVGERVIEIQLRYRLAEVRRQAQQSDATTAGSEDPTAASAS